MPIFARNLSYYSAVDKINDNSFVINKDGFACIRKLELTEHQVEFNLEIIEGNSFDILLRTTPHDFENKKNIRINYFDDKITLFEDEKPIFSKYLPEQTQEPFYIKIINDGKHLKFHMNCVDILYETNFVLTEYLLIKNDPNTMTRVSGIVFDSIIENESISQ